MKLTQDQESQLRKLTFDGTPNKAIAAIMDIPLTEVHAHRSRLGITRDKVAQGTGKPAKQTINPDFEAAVQQMTAKPDFEAAAAKMDKAVATARNCSTCAHWACYAKGTDCTMTNCPSYISPEGRRKSYLFDRKKEFICAIARQDIGVLPQNQVQEIKAFLDQYIPDDWRGDNG